MGEVVMGSWAMIIHFVKRDLMTEGLNREIVEKDHFNNLTNQRLNKLLFTRYSTDYS